MTKQEEQEIKRLYLTGQSIDSVSSTLNIGRYKVAKFLKEKQLSRDRIQAIKQAREIKVSEEDKGDIINQYIQGKSMKDLAEEYCTHLREIKRIIKEAEITIRRGHLYMKRSKQGHFSKSLPLPSTLVSEQREFHLRD